MGIAWREAPVVLVALLRRHGLGPDQVDNVDMAWKAFCAGALAEGDWPERLDAELSPET